MTRGKLCITPSGEHILPGVTQKILLEIAKNLNLETSEYFCSLDELLLADEVILAGTTTEALSVVKVDSKSIGEGIPGPISQKLRASLLNRC